MQNQDAHGGNASDGPSKFKHSERQTSRATGIKEEKKKTEFVALVPKEKPLKP